MKGTDPRQTEDGWTVHWEAYGGLSYSDIVNQYNGVNGITVDIVDLNYDEWVSAPNGKPLLVPLGPNAAGPTWYQRPEGFYVSKTLTLPITAVEEDARSRTPERFVLRQNIPNPFNPQTTIPYVLAQTAKVSL